MRLPKVLMTTLVALAFLAGLAMPAAAQEDAPLQIEDLEGIQQAVARQFTLDPSALAEAATPGATPDGLVGVITMAMSFETEEDAARAVSMLGDDLVRTDLAGEGGTVEEVQLDIDSDHLAYLISANADGMSTTILAAIAQDDAAINIVMVATLGADPEPVATRTLTDMAEAEAGDGEGTFNPDGTSTGGLWDKLPNAEALAGEFPGQVTVEDETLYPESSAPVASTPVRVSKPVTASTPAG